MKRMLLGEGMSLVIKVLVASVCWLGFTQATACAQGPENDRDLRFRSSGLPHWSEFPAPPTDVPTLTEIRANVKVVNVAQERVNREVTQISWDEGNAQSYASKTLARVVEHQPPAYDGPVSVAEIEAFAAQLHRRAPTPLPYDRY